MTRNVPTEAWPYDTKYHKTHSNTLLLACYFILVIRCASNTSSAWRVTNTAGGRGSNTSSAWRVTNCRRRGSNSTERSWYHNPRQGRTDFQRKCSYLQYCSYRNRCLCSTMVIYVAPAWWVPWFVFTCFKLFTTFRWVTLKTSLFIYCHFLSDL